MYSIVLDKLISEKVLKEPWLTQEPHKCLIAGQQFCYHCMKRVELHLCGWPSWKDSPDTNGGISNFSCNTKNYSSEMGWLFMPQRHRLAERQNFPSRQTPFNCFPDVCFEICKTCHAMAATHAETKCCETIIMPSFVRVTKKNFCILRRGMGNLT